MKIKLKVIVEINSLHNEFISTIKEHAIASTSLKEVYIDGLRVGDNIEKFDIHIN